MLPERQTTRTGTSQALPHQLASAANACQAMRTITQALSLRRPIILQARGRAASALGPVLGIYPFRGLIVFVCQDFRPLLVPGEQPEASVNRSAAGALPDKQAAGAVHAAAATTNSVTIQSIL